jgi:hypothetical protein
MITPAVHCGFPLWEIFGDFVLNCIDWSADVPEVSPFGIVWWRYWGVGLVLRRVRFHELLVSSGSFSELWSGSDLKIIFGEDVLDLSAGIHVGGSLGEEFLHHVQKGCVLCLIDSGIFDDNAPVFLKGISDSLAVLSTVSLSLQEGSNIHDGNFKSGKSEGNIFECSLKHFSLIFCFKINKRRGSLMNLYCKVEH